METGEIYGNSRYFSVTELLSDILHMLHVLGMTSIALARGI